MTETITPQELKALVDKGNRLQLVDVRGPGEFSAGHVPRAVNLPMEQVERRLDDLGAEEPIVLICQSGNRACLTKGLLRPHRRNLLVLDGGTDAWLESGLPVVRSASSRWAIERQVRLIAGLLVLIGSLLTVFGFGSWVYLAMFIGAGLTFSGLTNFCGMASILGWMPWNKPAKMAEPTQMENAIQ